MNPRTLFAVGIGGTGAKCVESLIHLHALGLLGNAGLKILLVDADESNGNGERTQGLLETYSKVNHAFRGGLSPLMSGTIENYGLWSPLNRNTDKKTLRDIFDLVALKSTQPDLVGLMEGLYSNEELDADLEVGFRGRPAIGSAIMSRISLAKEMTGGWEKFFQSLKEEIKNGVDCQIVTFSSIFGGTGAAGAPAICSTFKRLMKEGELTRVPLGAVLILPYFGFDSSGNKDKDNKVFASSENFLMNTEGALNYYARYGNEFFDTAYVVGNARYERYEFSLGNRDQRNAANIMELYGALAAQRFMEVRGKERGQVCIMGRGEAGKFRWEDLPGEEDTKRLLINGVRFAYAWKDNISPDLDQALKIGLELFAQRCPWFSCYYSYDTGGLMRFFSSGERPRFDKQQQEYKKYVDEWVKQFISWLSQILRYNGEQIHLFNATSRSLRDLVLQSGLEAQQQKQDSYHHLRLRLVTQDGNEVGTKGLAHALYESASLESVAALKDTI